MRGRWRVLGDDGGQRGQGVVALERRASLERGPQRDPERPQVGRRRGRLAVGALGGDVRRRPHHHPGGGQRRVAVEVGDAEVAEHGPPAAGAAAEHDVPGLDVAVQDPGRVRRGEPGQQVDTDRGDLVRGQHPPLGDDVVQRARRQRLHHDPGSAVLLHDVEDRHRAVGGDPGRGARLAHRPGAQGLALRGVDAGWGDDLLDGDGTLQHLVAAGPDDAHPAPAEHLGEPVPAADEAAVSGGNHARRRLGGRRGVRRHPVDVSRARSGPPPGPPCSGFRGRSAAPARPGGRGAGRATAWSPRPGPAR